MTPDVAKGIGTRLQQQATEQARVAPGCVQRCDATEAGAEQTPRLRFFDQWIAIGHGGQQLVGKETRVPFVAGVFLEPIRRVRQRNDHRRNLERMDEVVEDDLQ